MAYVCFITDAFSRMIVGWRVASHMRTDRGSPDVPHGVTPSRRTGRPRGHQDRCINGSTSVHRSGSTPLTNFLSVVQHAVGYLAELDEVQPTWASLVLADEHRVDLSPRRGQSVRDRFARESRGAFPSACPNLVAAR